MTNALAVSGLSPDEDAKPATGSAVFWDVAAASSLGDEAEKGAQTNGDGFPTSAPPAGAPTGDPNGGDLMQYDELRIEHDQSHGEIVVSDRAMLLFTTDSEALRRIHQVCRRLDIIAARHGRA
jgi:hypothetical protein